MGLRTLRRTARWRTRSWAWAGSRWGGGLPRLLLTARPLRNQRSQAACRQRGTCTLSASATLPTGSSSWPGLRARVLEAAGAAKSLLDSYGLYKHRAALHLEGAAYVAGDFRITLSRATSRPANDFRGLVVDAEYRPLAAPAAAAPALAELGELLREAAEVAVPAATFQHVEESHAEFGLPEAYSNQHLAVSLVQLMTTLA